jgi:mono/diheme cytochrome c family protein
MWLTARNPAYLAGAYLRHIQVIFGCYLVRGMCQRFLSVKGAAALALAAAAGAAAADRPAADPGDAAQVALGAEVYAGHCAVCHGAELEGQPDWRERLPSGRLPAPPHDASGHTWHHPDAMLFTITRDGIEAIVPGYASDMPAFGDVLDDAEIWAVLAFIKSRWPDRERAFQAEISAAAEE